MIKSHRLALAAAILPAALQAADVPAPGLEEIVVTAQKREESLQETPLAVTAITADAIRELGIESIADLGNLAPGFSYSQDVLGSRGGLLSIRGISTPADPMGSLDTTIGMYIDGVYLARPTQMVADLLDIERIEILRGPQGTLFGRNTTGGAVSFVTRAPREDFAFEQSAGFGGRDLRTGRTVLHSGDLLDGKLRASVTYLHSERDGIVDNINASDDKDPGAYERDVARVALRLALSESVTLDYTFDWSEVTNVPGAFQLFATVPYLAEYLGRSPNFGGSSVLVSDKRQASLSLDQRSVPVEDQLDGHALVLTAELDAFTLKSISAYRDSSHDTPANNLDGLPPDVRGLLLDPETFAFRGVGEYELYGGYDSTESQDQFQQEITLVSNGSGPWEWTVGAFYFEESTDSSDPQFYTFVLEPGGEVPFPLGLPLSATTAYSSDAESFAVYGQTSYRPPSLDDRLGITVGARYSWDERSLDQDQPFVNRDDASFSEPTGHISVDYRLTDQSTAYARLSHGYRAGGFNVRTLQAAFDPEFIDQFEIGLKSDLLEERLRLNSAVYTSRYEDQQISRFGVDLNGGAATVIENAGRSEYNGFEIEMTALLTQELTFAASTAFNDVEIEEVKSTDGSNIADLYQVANTPETTAQASLAYARPIAGLGELSARVDWKYEDGFSFFSRDDLSTFNSRVNRESTRIVDARIRLEDIRIGSSDWRFSVGAWGRNLTDEIYRARAIDFGALGFAGVVFSEPRTWGMDVGAEF
ncbi:MAG: TonB-dependent receptor [Pseudomonadales bacterium]|nr:TonB-dependent receptor [Pseudomonadales bacterium]MBP7909888.1 TonB-dependent receptor [Pseudomonadales bacterium]